ncbi:VOC family protein [Sphingomicrobium arenosum]|uniref:VOC family protein n=1 Tax=Sphingomicrobium arenosum TaxID=2233861 RepID=UPI002240EB3A|nr:VOC family protein [Sphingomicrobium arenosum]
MTKSIFINLPISNLAASTAFYEALGFERNPMFSNDKAAAMVWSEAITVMLLPHEFYATFTDKAIIDARTTSGALLCLTFDSKDAVDTIHRAARDAGGNEPRPAKAQGPMYGGAFEDPDGHIWETVWMDAAAIAEMPSA